MVFYFPRQSSGFTTKKSFKIRHLELQGKFFQSRMQKMHPSAPSSLLKERTVLPLTLTMVILIVIATALATSLQLRKQAEIRTMVTTQNMARSIEQTIESRLDIVDVTLQTSADEINRQMATGHVSVPNVTQFMARQLQRAPDISYLRAANEHGDIIYGPGVLSPARNIADRDYFKLLRNQSHAEGMQNRLLVGRITGKWAWLFIRRINKPNGAFGGVVFAGILTDRIAYGFSQFQLDSGGSISLRDAGMGLIAHYAPGQSIDIPPGDTHLTDSFAQARKVNPQEGTYINGTSSIASVSRTQSYQRNIKHGFTIDVGIAGEDALAEWRDQTKIISALAASFVVLSMVFAWLIDRAWRRQQAHTAALSKSKQALHEAQKIANIGNYSYDFQTNRWESSDILDDIFGIDADFPRDVEHWLALIAQESRQEARDHLKAVIEQRQPFDHEYRIIRPNDGDERWVHGKGLLQVNDDGQPSKLVGTIQDVTEHRQAEEALRKSEASFRNFFEENSSVMLLVDPDSTEIVGANKAATEYYGYPQQRLVGMPMRYINALPAEQVAEDRQCALRGERKNFVFTHRLASGEMREVEVFFSPIIIHGDRSLLFAIVHDITTRKQMEEQIRQLAFYDPLTQLPNRRLLNDRLSLALASSKRSGQYGAVMFLDLDNFKPLNDTHGHEVGDTLLIEVANRLKKCIREMDTVARLGGDEFVLVIGDLDQNPDTARTQARAVAEKIRIALAEPYVLNIRQDGTGMADIEHHCTTSIGVVLFSNESQNDILKWADTAMYQAKDAGRNLVRFYTPAQ